MDSNLELVNFECLAPCLMKYELLSAGEYQNITGRSQVPLCNHFKIFIEEMLDRSDKGDVVKNFLDALRCEKTHTGHADLLEKLQKNKTILTEARGK